MSLPAILAALFINVYRDHPVLQQPYRLLAALMDIEETLTLWRYRHALMVQRMIGVKIGTGGSSGHDYLRRTVERHRIFADLFQLSTYLIPRSTLPPLPPEVEAAMGFVYAVSSRPSGSSISWRRHGRACALTILPWWGCLNAIVLKWRAASRTWCACGATA